MGMNMIFLGPPGIGKGTHAGLVAKHYGIPKISTGDILREMVKKGTELGLEAKGYMDKGELVPDDLVIRILKHRISQDDCKRGFILDGFPRTIPQAKALEKITHIDFVLKFKAPHETIIERVSGRYTCKKCGAIYHTKNLPPKHEGICDKCGGPLYRRPDDRPAVVKNRLEVYDEETAPLIEFYKKKGVLVEVDVRGEVTEVNARLLKLLKQKLKV